MLRKQRASGTRAGLGVGRVVFSLSTARMVGAGSKKLGPSTLKGGLRPKGLTTGRRSLNRALDGSQIRKLDKTTLGTQAWRGLQKSPGQPCHS